MEWDMGGHAANADPDATWVDLIKGRRGHTLKEAKTACLPAARTQCLSAPPRMARKAPLRGVVPLPAEHTCLGQMVSGDPEPRDDLATVFEFSEGIIERVHGAVEPTAEPGSSPWMGAAPGDATPKPATPRAPAGGEPSDLPAPVRRRDTAAPSAPEPSDLPAPVRPRSSSSKRNVPQARPDVSEAGPALADAEARAATYLRGQDADNPGPRLAPGAPGTAQVQQGLQARCGPRSLVQDVPNVPTWAGCATQMEGPGVWMEASEGQSAVARRPSPQRYLPTMISAVPPANTVKVSVRRRSVMDQVVPFTLVLIAISLATAALVGAYL